MLHPGIGDNNEEAGNPRAQEYHEGRSPMGARRKALFAKQKQSQKRRLQEKRKNAFHRQRLADDAASGAGKLRPVGPELEFHGNAGDHADKEVKCENSRPESRRLVVALVFAAQRDRLQHHDQQSQSHS